MPRPFKKILVKLLLGLLDGAKFIGAFLLGVLKIVTLPFVWMWRLGLRKVAFLLYRLFVRIKVATGTLMAPFRKTLMAVLGHRYVVHAMMVLIVCFVSLKSVAVSADELGAASRDSLIYQLIQLDSDIGIDEEFSEFPEEGVLDEVASSTGTYTVITYDQSGLAVPITLPTSSEEPIERVVIAGPEKYTVQSGDTISGIAQKYGVSINTLLWANGMTSRSLLRIGQELTVLPVSGVLHTVKKGETVSGIAKKYDTDVDKILTANRVASVNEIQIGEELVIPDGRPPAAPAPPRPVAAAPKPAAAIKEVFFPSTEAPPAASADVGSLVWPTDSKRINQYYKWRHPGLDINGKLDNGVYSVDAGIVTYAGWNTGGYGNMILIDHGNGMITRYAHHSKMYVKAGDQVTKGQTIGMVGSTGRSTGPHLHFELYWNGSRRNPFEFYK